MIRLRKILFLALIGVVGLDVRAETSLQNRIEVVPQYRRLNSEKFNFKSDNFDAYLLVNSQLQWSKGSWFVELAPEIRAVVSEGVGENPPEDISIQTSRRTLNTRRTLRYREDGEAYFDFDLLNIRYSVAGVEMYAGRRPISLGVLRFFPVWNKLTLPLLFEPGPEWIENPDVAGASTQIGNVSIRTFAIRGNEPKTDDLALAEVRYYGQGFEIQWLGGYWWEHAAGGLALSFDVFDSTIRSETLWVGRRGEDKSQVQSGIGLETALSAKWTLVAEGYYQSAGLTDVKNVLSPPNRFMVLSGRFYGFPYFIYQLNPLWKLNAGFIVNLDNETSYIGLGGFEHSLGDNTTLTLKIKWPFGIPEGEFGDRRFEDALGRTTGLPSTIFLAFEHVF